MKFPPRRSQSGFTLIEIAVVLVVVGLLIGGIMKGQEMINSAKVKNLGADLRNASSFAMAYQDKFRAMPGDDKAALSHVGGTSASTPAETLGNGSINGSWKTTTQTDESYLFWQHVRKAGLAAGSTTLTEADYLPKNAFGGKLGITGVGATSGTNSWTGSLFACASAIPGSAARQLDTTMDDGNTATGSLRVVGADEADISTGVSIGLAEDGNKYTVCLAL